MIVVDASVVAPALADDGDDGDRARARLRGESLAVPELLDVEVLSVLRKICLRGGLPDRRAALAVADLRVLPARRVPHRLLTQRTWDLRATVTPYDGVYIALAEALDTTLVTADARLARAAGPLCEIELIA